MAEWNKSSGFLFDSAYNISYLKHGQVLFCCSIMSYWFRITPLFYPYSSESLLFGTWFWRIWANSMGIKQYITARIFQFVIFQDVLYESIFDRSVIRYSIADYRYAYFGNPSRFHLKCMRHKHEQNDPRAEIMLNLCAMCDIHTNIVIWHQFCEGTTGLKTKVPVRPTNNIFCFDF